MTHMKLVIGNKNYSSWSLRPWLFLKKNNIEFIEERLALDTPSFKAQVRDYGSGGKVPVLLDGEFTVWDSLAIMEYLSEHHTDNAGWPKELHARARARSISAEMHSSFGHLREEMPMNCRKVFQNYQISAAAQNDVDRISTLWCECRREYAHLGDWLLGDFSIADAMFAPVALRFRGYQIALSGRAADYLNMVLDDTIIGQWVDSAKQEVEVVENDER